MWLKAFHLIFMVTWFAGLFYLPRLFVYHAQADDTISKERFKIMERKLYFGIMIPGMVLTLGFGTAMLFSYAWDAFGTALWLHIKLGLIGLLIIYHFMCGKYVADFKADRNRHGHVFYRWFNEFPVLLLIGIVLLASVRPV